MDPDDRFAQQWQNSAPAVVQQANEISGESDDHWFVPHYTVTKNLVDQLDTIEKDSATHLLYRPDLERVDIWGPYECIQKAKQSLDHFAKFYLEVEEKKQREKRTKGWAKPDRELTASEKRKLARQEKRLLETQRYLGKPVDTCAYIHLINWPKEISAFRLLGGDKLHILTPLRNEFKCYIWMEQQLLYVAGDDKEMTYSAMNRVKNYLLKRFRQTNEQIYHILERPSKLVRIELLEFPPVPYIMLPVHLAMRQSQDSDEGPGKFVATTEVAEFATLRELDLGIAGGRNLASSGVAGQTIPIDSKKDEYFEAMKYYGRMMDSNIERIGSALENALEDVQVLDGDIKMRIRLGQVTLKAYPGGRSWDVQHFDSTIIPDNRLESEFSPFFTNDPEKFSSLIKKLTPPNSKELSLEPEMHWTLVVLRRDQVTNKPVEVQLDVTFRDERFRDNDSRPKDYNNVAFWNALVQKITPLDIRVISAERSFSWAWIISAGRRLDADKFSPEGKFVHELRLEERNGEDPRLVYANTSDVQLRHVKRERKWLFPRDPWTIELTEEAFWTFDSPSKPYQKLTLSDAPQQVSYSVSMYRDSWVSRFCENPHLGLGQLPGWEPSDFLKDEEAISKTIEAVSEVRDIIERLL
ncbi:hypothetical protein BGZ76_011594 [Entomortierella beljakovae]|nr:hypothetical protein BGZ76_011594 [Entomortierella beljakovae]